MTEPARNMSWILTADWILPIEHPPIFRGGVLIREGLIERVLTSEELAGFKPTPDICRMDLGRAALLPGLVNAHSHLELTALRGLCEETSFFPWIRKLTSVKYGALSPGDYACSARWGALNALRSGITTVADASDSGEVFSAVVESGLRGIVYLETFGPDPRQLESSMANLRARVDTLLSAATDRVRIGVSPHAPYTVSKELFQSTAELALSRGIPMCIHVAESQAERQLVREGAGPFADHLRARGIHVGAMASSSIAYLEQIGVLEARPLLIHCVDVDSEDIARLKTKGVSIAHCPKSNAKLGHGIAPLQAFAASGIKIGLGTDGAVTSNNCDLFEEARFAALAQRCTPTTTSRHELLAPADFLRILTLGGAEALGLEQLTGSLVPGKNADLTAVRLEGAHIEPIYDPAAALLFSACQQDVILTMVAGRILYHAGECKTLDEAALRGRLSEIAARLSRIS